jgi:aspartyl protease family protein
MTGLLSRTLMTVALVGGMAVLFVGHLTRGFSFDVSSLDSAREASLRSPPAGGGGVGRPPMAGNRGAVALTADGTGHFSATPSVNGTRVAMLVDTGASVVVLSEEDAGRAGLRPLPADFTARMTTANGTTFGAPVVLREVRLGDIVLRDVKAVVLPRDRLNGSLLGMSFLSRLSGFEIVKDRLLLKP